MSCSKDDESTQDEPIESQNPIELIIGTWIATKDVVDCFPNSEGNESIDILDDCQNQSTYVFETANGPGDVVLFSSRYYNYNGTCNVQNNGPITYRLLYDGDVLLMRILGSGTHSTIFKLTDTTLQIGRFDSMCNGGNTASHRYREYSRVD